MDHRICRTDINDLNVTFYSSVAANCALIFCDLNKVDNLVTCMKIIYSDFGDNFPIYIALNFLITGQLCDLTVMQKINCKGIFAITNNNNLLQVENVIHQYLNELRI